MDKNTPTTNQKLKVSTETIIRTVCLALALINQLLTVAGHNPLPIADEQIASLLSTAITIAAAVWAWWKNNSFTRQALTADKMMADWKHDERRIK